MEITGIWNSHMYVFLLISGFLLFHKAYTLKCYECSPNNDGCSNNETECPSGSDRCVTGKRFIYLGGDLVDFPGTTFKGCTSSEHCAEGSVTCVQERQVINRQCCDTDFCNDQPIPEPAESSPNGKKCITCYGDGDCFDSLDCVNNEDHCFSFEENYNDHVIYVKGCVSKDLCSEAVRAALSLNMGEGMVCCQGDNCNRFMTETTTRASRSETRQATTSTSTSNTTSTCTRSTASTLPVLVPLVSLVFFS